MSKETSQFAKSTAEGEFTPIGERHCRECLMSQVDLDGDGQPVVVYDHPSCEECDSSSE